MAALGWLGRGRAASAGSLRLCARQAGTGWSVRVKCGRLTAVLRTRDGRWRARAGHGGGRLSMDGGSADALAALEEERAALQSELDLIKQSLKNNVLVPRAHMAALNGATGSAGGEDGGGGGGWEGRRLPAGGWCLHWRGGQRRRSGSDGGPRTQGQRGAPGSRGVGGAPRAPAEGASARLDPRPGRTQWLTPPPCRGVRPSVRRRGCRPQGRHPALWQHGLHRAHLGPPEHRAGPPGGDCQAQRRNHAPPGEDAMAGSERPQRAQAACKPGTRRIQPRAPRKRAGMLVGQGPSARAARAARAALRWPAGRPLYPQGRVRAGAQVRVCAAQGRAQVRAPFPAPSDHRRPALSFFLSRRSCDSAAPIDLSAGRGGACVRGAQ